MPWLTGDEIPEDTFCRVIRLPNDPVFIQAVNGALLDLAYAHNWEQLGTLTPQEVADKFDEIYIEYTKSKCDMTPVGGILMWQAVVAPPNWLLCDGGAAFVAEWPELFDLWGYKYGGSGTQFGLPDIGDLSPMGQGGNVGLDEIAGTLTHTLTLAQIPAHQHRIPKMSATVNAGVNTSTPNARTDNTATPTMMTDNAGGGGSHPNLHPVWGTNFIVYAGRQV